MDGEHDSQCECCGTASRCVWGFVHEGPRTVASYWVHWTLGHLDEHGANFDLAVGE